MSKTYDPQRRLFLKTLGTFGAGLALAPHMVLQDIFANELLKDQDRPWLKKTIPSSGEKIPVIGMGTWQTFHVEDDTQKRLARTDVLKEFFRWGGGMIDSSPMYGTAEEVIGFSLNQIDSPSGLFSASKIWTPSTDDGARQFQDSQNLWGVQTFDLFQIHNLLNWSAHLETLNELKHQGKVRYIGMTTSHGRRHRDLENIIKTQKFDFLQVTYNIVNRQVEERILPMAADAGLAVIANRPYDGGALMDRLKPKSLPAWAKEWGFVNWADFLLKFVVSHPAMTCAIPATTQVAHMAQNMAAGFGVLPDAKIRKRMVGEIERI